MPGIPPSTAAAEAAAATARACGASPAARLAIDRAPAPAHDDDGIPLLDWRGRALDCAACAQADLHAAGRCRPGHACVEDRYARRIDRFFQWNPQQANASLGHPYFERRAIAARRADLFRLPALVDDPDETVRLQVALRLPPQQLLRLRADAHREVRIRVAWRLPAKALPSMVDDEDYHVRQIVARRIALPWLPRLARDADSEVRLEVARRIGSAGLLTLRRDPADAVRREVARRLPAGLLHLLLDDADWLVRWETAQRAPHDLLRRLLHDAEAEVRQAALQRLMQPLPGAAAADMGAEDDDGRHQP